MEPRTFLRLEGLVVFALALAGYVLLEGPIWLLLVLALAPDLSMLGYLAGPRVGSLSYNVVHTYALALVLGAFGLWADVRLALLLALIWIGHIGADRLVGTGSSTNPGSSTRTSQPSLRRPIRPVTPTSDRLGASDSEPQFWLRRHPPVRHASRRTWTHTETHIPDWWLSSSALLCEGSQAGQRRWA
jgi:hypothetical protein